MRGIVTLCGSTRFVEDFNLVSLDLTLADYVVLSIGSHLQSDDQLKYKIAEEEKKRLDALHLEKIEMSQAVVILNRDGYVGSSTKSEILYAKKLDKNIYWLYPEYAHSFTPNPRHWLELLYVSNDDQGKK